MDEELNKAWLILCELLTITGIDSYVRQGCSTIVLYIDVERGEKLDKYGYGTRVYKLLSILVCERLVQKFSNSGCQLTRMCHIQQRASCVSFNSHVLRFGQPGQRT